MSQPINRSIDYPELAKKIKTWGKALGFDAVGITDTELTQHETHLFNWLDKGFHGEMDYMQRHGTKRSRPEELEPGTLRVISVRMNYWPDADSIEDNLQDSARAFVSRYAQGRDYHKVLRNRLQKLAERIKDETGQLAYRAYTDSAPVLEKALAEKAGLGWIGKHSNLLAEHIGSWFFLGELYIDLPLPIDTPTTAHCGTCTACIDICPTQAIVAPYQVDARRCISYLTIELHGSIPETLRPLIGNRIYGCDDCQQVCPWNRFAKTTELADFQPRHGLDTATLIELFSWDETTFMKKTEGSAIRRIGHTRWLRNIAVALGNSDGKADTIFALEKRRGDSNELVEEHIDWALTRIHSAKSV